MKAAGIILAAGESRRMSSEGWTPVLKKSRWLLLKREENLKTEQRFRLRDLLRYNLKTVRAYLLVVPLNHAIPHRTHEENRPLPTQPSRTHSQLFPRSKTALQRRRRRPKKQGQSHHKKSYGFRTYRVLELALLRRRSGSGRGSPTSVGKYRPTLSSRRVTSSKRIC